MSGLQRMMGIAAVLLSACEAEAAEAVRYARDIRPILADNCFTCHGPDVESREAELRLDTAEGQRMSAIVPGSPDASPLMERVLATDEDMLMPPPHTKRRLTDQQKDLLRQWIAEGAEVEGHWAFEAPSQPRIPATSNDVWVRNPIDAWVLAELQARNLQPSPEAERATLVRRLSLDLTGLPPTPEEVQQFVADARPDAYEQLVDRLLASPRFGERFAQVWLDVARYADTNGYNNDEERIMWRWRDWVIEAFNRNLPYDQFVREQLAGDLLPQPTLQQRLATGFNRNHVLTTEGGIIDEEYRVEYVADRVQTTVNVLLGLTLQCARCHDHKYDPISQREYFELYAFFNQSPDKLLGYNQGAPATPYLKAPTREQQRQLAALEAQQQRCDQRLAARREQLDQLVRDWETSLPADSEHRSAALELAHHFRFEPTDSEGLADTVDRSLVAKSHGKPAWSEGRAGQALELDGQSYLELGQTPSFEQDEPFTFSVWLFRTQSQDGTVLSKMHDSAAHRGYDLLVVGDKPEVHLVHHWPDNAIHVVGQTSLALHQWQHLCLTYDGSSRAAGVKLYVDGVLQQLNVGSDALTATIRTERPFHIGRRGEGLPWAGKLDELTIYRRELAADEVARVARGESARTLASVLDQSPESRPAAEQQWLAEYYFHRVDTDVQHLREERRQVEQQLSELEKAVPTALVMEDLAEPRKTFLLERGQYDRPGAEVLPDVPDRLPPWDEAWPKNRLGFAQWILQPDHPLTSRIAVNRWWAVLFGTGLVETEEDFGIQGSLPSHPALLDWLAVAYSRPRDVANPHALGWDTKALVRLIVTSATYRQRSEASAELIAADPANRWLARGPRFRLTAEQVRDAALFSAGLLIEQQGGKSVYPYQPPGLWEEVSVERREKYEPSQGAGLYRRSMYTFWKRTCPPPLMTVFDAPDREFCVIRRARTNTPLQALALLNDVTYIEAARELGERVLQTAGDDFGQQLELAFAHVLARQPDDVERQVFRQLYDDARQQFAADPAAASQLLDVGAAPCDERLARDVAAAWTLVANTLLNLDETLTKE